MPLIAGLAVLWFMVIAWATRDGRDAAHDGRSIDRYSNAMRVLSRRAPKAAPSGPGRYIVVPTAAVTSPSPAPVRGAMARRKAILRRLIVASGTSFAGILLGGPWLWIHLGVDALLVGYVVFLRRVTLRTAEAARGRRRADLARREAEHRAAYEAAHAAAATDATVHVMPDRDEHRRAVND